MVSMLERWEQDEGVFTMAQPEWAKVDGLKEGDQIKAVGIPCLAEDEFHTVKRNHHGQLYVNCRHGEHFLGGQTQEVEPGVKVMIGIIKCPK